MKLTHTEELFIAEYIGNGGNGTQAYLAIKPAVTSRAGAVCANRILKRPAVLSRIRELIDKKTEKAISNKEYLIQQAHEIGEDAIKKDKHGSALKAVDLKGKLAGVYKDDGDTGQGFKNIVNQILIKTSAKEEDKVVDVTPEGENPDTGSH